MNDSWCIRRVMNKTTEANATNAQLPVLDRATIVASSELTFPPRWRRVCRLIMDCKVDDCEAKASMHWDLETDVLSLPRRLGGRCLAGNSAAVPEQIEQVTESDSQDEFGEQLTLAYPNIAAD